LTLGIVGLGRIGRQVAARMIPFGIRVIAYDPHLESAQIEALGARSASFEALLRQSDIVSLHVPQMAQTAGMIDASRIAAMKPGAILINTARGGLVDEAALAEALRTGTIAGAGFDVLTKEPPREGNVLLDATIPNLIVTPHVAWASQEAMQILADQLIDNIEAFVAGKPQNVVE
ncbi:MAG: NAD(P)-dependent oxidoreductase, partial [Methyloceanibacter sp.]